MALSLAACGGSSTTTTTATDTTTTDTTTTDTTTTTGSALALTATVAGDDLVGGAGDDTFTGASSARFQSADVLTGGAGTDTLTAKITGTITPTIDEIEVLNLDATATASIDGATISSEATTVNVSGGNTLTYLAQDSEVFTVSEASTGLTVTRTATDTTSDAITVTVNAGALGTLTLGSAAAGADYETFNIVVGGAGSATLTEGGTAALADTGDKVVVTGTGDYTLNIAGAALGANTATTNAVAADVSGAGHTGALTVDIGALGANEFFEASKLVGVDVLRLSTGSGDDDTIMNLLADTAVYVDAIENAANELTIDPNGALTTDVLDLTLAHGTAGSSIDLNALIVNGFETVNIVSSGTNTATATVVNVLDDVAGLTTDTKLNISGDKKLTATGVENTFTTITSTNTVGVDLTVDSGGALTFTGGAGADRLELDTVADLTALDTLVGGEGEDTLAFSAVPSAISLAQLARVSGFETIEFEETNTVAGNFTLDIDGENISTVIFTGELTTDSAKQMTIAAVSGLRIEMGGHTATGTDNDDLIVSILNAANAGTNDTVTLALANITANDAHAGLHIDNVENFVVDVTGDASHTWTVADIDGAQLTNLTVMSSNTTANTASDALTITDVESTLINTINMSAMTGTTDITGLNDNLIATGATITGGSGNDSITGGTGADTINGGAGDDTLLGAGGNDNITAGNGTDGITAGTGSDTVDVSETVLGVDSIVQDFEAGVIDYIIGFNANTAAELGDNLDIDVSDLDGLTGFGDIRTGDGTASGAQGTPVVTVLTAATDMGAANTDIYILSGDFASTGAVETALETGGSLQLTSDDATANYATTDGFLVAYDDGTNTYLGTFQFTTDPGDNAVFASGDLTVTNFVQFTGLADATTLTSTNFDII